jgi:hypothetical protein
MGISTASGSVPDRRRCPKITSVSSGVGGGIELDAPPTSTLMAGAGIVGASSAAADGVLDGIAVVEAAVAVRAVGTPSAAAAPLLPDPQLEPRVLEICPRDNHRDEHISLYP